MRKFIGIFMVVAFLAFFTGCAVNETTSSITVYNTSDKDAFNVKVGDVFIGTVLKGQTTTVYFFAEKNGSEIVAEKFEARPSINYINNVRTETKTDGKIDLKLNFAYNLSLYLNDGKYYFSASGTKVGVDGKNTTNDDYISMK